ncbi:peritrophin-1-like [Leguminivora glycinivorella]|uniref:peritrophin-1-like n=1 Tax=Leguminivora glycinivorella TaxID=1035111 RepID=UPI00200C8510|nr:peritrophin-1-like [Leguminivora glycinivorella]
MYSILLVTLLAASALGAQCPPEGSPFFNIPHETDCSKFYTCAHGVPVLKTCPEGTHFSPMHLVCQDPVFAGCDNTLPALCPDWSLLPRPHPDDCSKFIVCQYGTVHVFNCSDGLEFNAELQECVWPSESNCTASQTSSEKPSTEPSQDGGQENGGEQDGGQDSGEQDGGQENGGEEDGSSEGSCVHGELSNNKDCSKYNVCDNGVQVAMDCPAGLQWNSELSFCDWPELAGCQ